MPWKRLIKVPLVVAACGWSWASYLLIGHPADKVQYLQNAWNWLSPDLEEHWTQLENANGRTYHELKNVGVEYARAHAQPAMKSLCMFLMLGWLGCFIFGLLSLALFLA